MLAEFDPIATYAYHVEIDSITIAQFKQVSGLSISVGVIEHRANKLLGQPIMKKLPGAVKFRDAIDRQRTGLSPPGEPSSERRTSTSAPAENGSKRCSMSHRMAMRLRHAHHARITSRSTCRP